MISVAAAALLAGAGFANAQGMGHEGGAAGGAATTQSAPSSAGGSATTPGHEATEPAKPSSGMKSTQSEQKSPAAGKNERAEDMQGQKSKSMSSDNAKGGGKDMKAEGREDSGKMKAEGREDNGKMKAEGREDSSKMKAEGRNGNMNAEQKGSAESKTTVGQAGAGAKLSTEQRTKITSVIREQHVAPVEHVDFSISVGTRVPRNFSFHPLPADIVTIYPDWRGYEFFLVRDQIVVVDPRTFEIVAVLEA
jgi:hypothetical protein